MFAGERSELSRGVDGLAEVDPDESERSPKSPGTWYTLLENTMLES